MSERIKERMKLFGLKQEDLAEEVGFSQTAIQKILAGGGTRKIVAIAKVLQCTPEWLETGIGNPDGSGVREGAPPQYIHGIDSDNYVSVVSKTGTLRATIDGFEIHDVEDEDAEPAFYRKTWVDKNGYKAKNLYIRRVRGSSMEWALFDGDRVLLNKGSRDPKNGKAFEVIIDGILCVKRLQRRGSEWWITSDNPAHKNTDMPLENLDQIQGEVIEMCSNNV